MEYVRYSRQQGRKKSDLLKATYVVPWLLSLTREERKHKFPQFLLAIYERCPQMFKNICKEMPLIQSKVALEEKWRQATGKEKERLQESIRNAALQTTLAVKLRQILDSGPADPEEVSLVNVMWDAKTESPHILGLLERVRRKYPERFPT